jgi:NAD(P)-dependent dehydrogenase (short-subunit alcohol dehydrogenase family)
MHNKTVFITGAARRIGKGLALRFAEKGWNIALNYNSSENEANITANKIKEFGVECKLYQADITKEGQVISAIKRAFDDYGKIDVLINNAGVYPPKKSLLETDLELWDKMLNTNTRGTMLCSREFSRFANEGARIINFASLGAYEVWKQRLAYNVSEAGVAHLTRALAKELAPKISVNSISPGSILIPEEKEEHDLAIDNEKIPMGRFGKIDDIFDAVYFFATCSPYITGQNLNIDGGYHL